MNLQEQFIPYELALKLKELGFSESCFGVYFPDGSYRQECGLMNYPKELFANVIKAPLWQQAFYWFREKHNLPNWVHESTGKWYFKIVQGDFWVQHQGIVFKSYQEARQACLEKLIEIVENENKTD